MKTAAQSSLSEPDKYENKISNKKSSVLSKIIFFLIIIIGLTILYYADYHGIKSQGVLHFIKSISNTKTTMTKNSKTTKVTYKNGKKQVKVIEGYD